MTAVVFSNQLMDKVEFHVFIFFTFFPKSIMWLFRALATANPFTLFCFCIPEPDMLEILIQCYFSLQKCVFIATWITYEYEQKAGSFSGWKQKKRFVWTSFTAVSHDFRRYWFQTKSLIVKLVSSLSQDSELQISNWQFWKLSVPKWRNLTRLMIAFICEIWSHYISI